MQRPISNWPLHCQRCVITKDKILKFIFSPCNRRFSRQYHHQLSLLTPGNAPLEANSRNAILDSRVSWYIPRPRPVSMHLFLTRVIDPLRDSPCSRCVDASLSVAGRDRLVIVDLSPLLFNSSLL